MKKRKSRSKRGPRVRRGNWVVTLDDGTIIDAGYYPNPRMAVGAVLEKYKGSKVKNVEYYSIPPTKAIRL